MVSTIERFHCSVKANLLRYYPLVHSSPFHLSVYKEPHPPPLPQNNPTHQVVRTSSTCTPHTPHLLFFSGRIHNFSEAVKLISKVHLACEGRVTVSKLNHNVWVVLAFGTTSLVSVKVLTVA